MTSQVNEIKVQGTDVSKLEKPEKVQALHEIEEVCNIVKKNSFMKMVRKGVLTF